MRASSELTVNNKLAPFVWDWGFEYIVSWCISNIFQMAELFVWINSCKGIVWSHSPC